MADPASLSLIGLGLLGGTAASGIMSAGGVKTPSVSTPAPAQQPATPPATGAGKQSFLSSAAVAPQQQQLGTKTLLGQ